MEEERFFSVCKFCFPHLCPRPEGRRANSLCWGEWVIEGGGSSPVESMWVDALQSGRWRPGDLFSAPHHSLRAFAAHCFSAAVPDGTTAGQDALDDAAVIAARSIDDIPNSLSLLKKSFCCWAFLTSCVMFTIQVWSSLMCTPSSICSGR